MMALVIAVVLGGRLGEQDIVMVSCSCTRLVLAADIVAVVPVATAGLVDMAAGHMVAVEDTAAVGDMGSADRKDAAARMAERIALVASRDLQKPKPQRPLS
jgi:hypothetical protein